VEDNIVINASDGRRKSRAAPVRVVLPDGSLFEMPPEYSKLSNANIKNIPRDLYRLQVMCQQRHLFAAVTQKSWHGREAYGPLRRRRAVVSAAVRP